MSSLELIRDLINTYDVESQADTLTSRAALARWLRERGLPATADLDETIEVREALRELLLANNRLPADVARASAVLDGAARRAHLRVRFADGAARVDSGGGLGALLAAAAEAMSSDEWPRLKACRAETCHWAFIDRAKNRSRSWCDMKTCGNRQKAQRYRERHEG